MSSIIRGDDNFDSNLNPPGLIQTVSTHFTGTFAQSFTANVQVAVDEIEAVITPTSTSSKILILVQWCGEASTTEENLLFGIGRNGTAIGQPAAAGNRGLGIFPVKICYHADRSSTMESVQFHYVDSPASTAELTYTILLRTYSTCTIYTNRTVTDSDSQVYERGSTSIILMEILL